MVRKCIQIFSGHAAKPMKTVIPLYVIFIQTWPRGYKTFFMLKAEYEMYFAYKS